MSNNLWQYMPDIARIMQESQMRLEQTTSANVGAYGIPIGGVLRRQSPAAVGTIQPNYAHRDGYDHYFDSDMQALLDYYNKG